MGIVAFQMPLIRPSWLYQDLDAPRHVEVAVDLPVLERLNAVRSAEALPSALIAANRAEIEKAARKIIDREGPNFLEPVLVTLNDL